MGDSKKAILATLIYSDIFDFPLTKEELYYYLNASQPLSLFEFKKELELSKHFLIYRNGLYGLKSRQTSIKQRQKHAIISQQKLEKAKKVARWLSYLPTTYFIGVSGSVAVGNAQRNDDIDFFVITKKNSLFVTRFLILCFLEILGVRRKRQEKVAVDKICLNMIIDEEAMQTRSEYQDLYTAREIAQLYPLFSRDDIYRKYLTINQWTRDFLPHALGHTKGYITKCRSPFEDILFIFEPVAKKVQLWFMNRHKTVEIVSNHFLAFHPGGTRERILDTYARNLAKHQKYYK